MKILLINSEYPPIGGGAGNAGSNLARSLVQRGHDVLVLTSHWDGLPFEENRTGIRIVRLSTLRRRMDRSNALEQVSFIFFASFRALSSSPPVSPGCHLGLFRFAFGRRGLVLEVDI